jgi:hypothetical protein
LSRGLSSRRFLIALSNSALGTTRSTCEQRDTALQGKFIGAFYASRATAC